jgi:hypothetical protein
MNHLRPIFVALLVAATFSACASRQAVVSRPAAPETMRTAETSERPGLGTGWGEHLVSHVEPAYFARAWNDRPNAVEKLFYNDRDGVDATLAFLGGEAKTVAGLQRAAGGLLRLGLRDSNGRWFDTVELRDHRFAIGERGSRYEVVLRNETRRRLEVVVSVDGLDTIEGDRASVRKRGYVLTPGETVAIEGFRTSPQSVAAFRFTNVGDTVSARQHQETRNVGVIGVAVYSERMLGTPAGQFKAEHRAWRIVEQPAATRPVLTDA